MAENLDGDIGRVRFVFTAVGFQSIKGNYQTICLGLACLIYALFGSPTPESLGWAELLIAFFLILSVGLGRAAGVVFDTHKKEFWRGAGQLFLVFGLIVPVLNGVLSGHALGAIIRDLIPFLFLFLPLLYTARVDGFFFAVISVTLIGLIFSLRSLAGHLGVFCSGDCGDQLLYLENMPTVLFSCLILIGVAMHLIWQKLCLKNAILSAGCFGLSLLPILAMIVSLQRASLGAVVLYCVLILGYFIYKSPRRGIYILIVGGLALMALNISFDFVLSVLVDKTQKVGLNSRPQEMAAVWNVVSSSPQTFFFGIGWGGKFQSPAVANLSVNFTHNFFSYILLKMGALGLVFCALYIAGLLERLARVVLQNPVLGLALSAPILIDLTLYASFKSLDFGLTLLMIPFSMLYLARTKIHIETKP